MDVRSEDINAYIKEQTGGDFTAKDFRTWSATLAAFRLLAGSPPPDGASGRALAQIQQQVLGEVSGLLGNTVSVCRKSYVDPCVFDGWEDGSLLRAASLARGERQWEAAARRFLARAHARQRAPVTRRQRRQG